MPARIVTETCPAPQCNLSEHDIEQFLNEMRDYIAKFAPAFQRAQQLERNETYVRGLLGDAARKNDEAHQDQREASGVPTDLKMKTKLEIGLELLKRAVERKSLPFQWVAADELYGDSPAFRDGVAELTKWYFTEIKCSTLIWKSRPEVHLPACGSGSWHHLLAAFASTVTSGCSTFSCSRVNPVHVYMGYISEIRR